MNVFSKIKEIGLAIFILIHAEKSFSFEFNKETCSLEQNETLVFKNGDSTFSTEVKTDFYIDSLHVPHLRILFLQHRVEKVFIEWVNINYGRSKNAFTSELKEIVSKMENEKIQMSPSSSLENSFETVDTDFRQTQSTVALFLSQESVTVSILGDDNALWSASLSLKSSDLSYRQMAIACFEELSAPYLNKKTRLTPSVDITKAVSDGYGLVYFNDALSLISSMKISENIPISDLNKIITLMTEKRKRQQDISTLIEQNEMKDLLSGYQASSQELKSVLDRIQTISGSGNTNNLLLQTQQKINEVNSDILKLQDDNKNLKISIEIANQDSSALQEKIKPFIPTLNEFDQKKIDLLGKKMQLIILLGKLEDMKSDTIHTLESGGVDVATLSGGIGTPWSLDTIQEKFALNEKIKDRYIFVVRLQKQLQQLLSETELLIQESSKLNTLYTEYTTSVAQQRKIGDTIKEKDKSIQNLNEIPYFSDQDEITFNVLNIRLEENMPSEHRDYDTEFSLHEDLFKKLRNEFQEQKQSILNSNKISIAKLICDPQFLLEPALQKSPCIYLHKIFNPEERQKIIDQLSPEIIDSLLQEAPKPWPYKDSKVKVLSMNIEKELNSSSDQFEILSQKWNMIRLVVWRWNVQQKEPTEFSQCEDAESLASTIKTNSFSSEFYQKVFFCEKKQVSSLEESKDSLIADFIVNSKNVEASNEKYLTQNDAYIEKSKNFDQQLEQLISNTQERAYFENNFSKCLTTDFVPSLCKTALTQELKQIDSAQALFSEFYQQVTAQLTSSEVQKNETLDEINKVEAERALFSKNNSIDDLLLQQDVLNRKRNEILNSIDANAQSISALQLRLAAYKQDDVSLRNEESALRTQASLLSLKENELSSQIAKQCIPYLQLRDQLLAIDLQIKEALSADENSEGSQSETQSPSGSPLEKICMTGTAPN